MKKTLILLPLISLLLASCGGSTSSYDESTPSVDGVSHEAQSSIEAQNAELASQEEIQYELNEGDATIEKKRIVTSFFPLAYFTAMVVGDKADVISIAGVADPHTYNPSPQDIVRLNSADLVIYQGAEFESWVDDLIPQIAEKGVATLEVTDGLSLAAMDEHGEHDNHGEAEDGHYDEHGEEDHYEDGHDSHDKHDGHHGEFDPHTWLDPVLAQDMVDAIVGALTSLDSENTSVYTENAEALKNRFAQLDREYTKQLTECAVDGVIVSHDAYGYLARRYGMTLHPIVGLSTEDIPSAKVLADLKEEAEQGITHILIEDNSVTRFAETLARETGLQVLRINPLSRGTLKPGKDFFDVMDDNLNSFSTALDCQ